MLNRLYGWYGKGVVRTVLGLVIVLVVGALYLSTTRGDETSTDTADVLPEVSVRTVRDFTHESTFTTVGTVRAVREANLQVESGGRITAVNVAVGDQVRAGAILASMENSAERAALLQAEGSYEAALAASRQGTVSLDESKVSVRNTFREAFTKTEAVVRGTLDVYYANPDQGIIGFRLAGSGRSEEFNRRRLDVRDILETWLMEINGGLTSLTEEEMLEQAEMRVTLVHDLTTDFSVLFSNEDVTNRMTDAEVAEARAALSGARTVLGGMLTAISTARQGYEQAIFAAEPDTTSLSSAQLKSALGNLRSAQSRYEKTLVRTPINGVVNALYLKAGDYATMGQPAVLVANNGTLEVSTALSEKDLDAIKIGDEVRIQDTVSGLITEIAPAIDPLSGKSEVKISIEDTSSLKNGSTVSVSFIRSREASVDDNMILLPLQSVKMLASGSIVFTVADDQTLTATPVTLGAIKGDSVVITDGITPDTRIVEDARGLMAGDLVTIKQ